MLDCNKNSCTCWFDGWFGKSWKKCCEVHDQTYIKLNHIYTRKEADKDLYDCVKKKDKFIAVVMYCGIRLFGWYYWNKYKKM